MDLESLHWLDWLGLSLAAYGLAAGAVRGMTQQFSRLLVWMAAVAGAGALSSLLDSLAGAFSSNPERVTMLSSWFQLAVVLLGVLLLGSLRRLLVGRLGNARTAADALLGAVAGLLLATLSWLLLLGTTSLIQGPAGLEESSGLPLARRLGQPYQVLPQTLKTSLLDAARLPPAAPADQD